MSLSSKEFFAKWVKNGFNATLEEPLQEVLNKKKYAQYARVFKNAIKRYKKGKKYHFFFTDMGQRAYCWISPEPVQEDKELLSILMKDKELGKNLRGAACGIFVCLKQDEERVYLNYLSAKVKCFGKTKKAQLEGALNEVVANEELTTKSGTLPIFGEASAEILQYIELYDELESYDFLKFDTAQTFFGSIKVKSEAVPSKISSIQKEFAGFWKLHEALRESEQLDEGSIKELQTWEAQFKTIAQSFGKGNKQSTSGDAPQQTAKQEKTKSMLTEVQQWFVKKGQQLKEELAGNSTSDDPQLASSAGLDQLMQDVNLLAGYASKISQVLKSALSNNLVDEQFAADIQPILEDFDQHRQTTVTEVNRFIESYYQTIQQLYETFETVEALKEMVEKVIKAIGHIDRLLPSFQQLDQIRAKLIAKLATAPNSLKKEILGLSQQMQAVEKEMVQVLSRLGQLTKVWHKKYINEASTLDGKLTKIAVNLENAYQKVEQGQEDESFMEKMREKLVPYIEQAESVQTELLALWDSMRASFQQLCDESKKLTQVLS